VFGKPTPNDTVYIKESPHGLNDNFLITLPRPGGFPGRGMVLCVAAKGEYTMLKHMRELQRGLIPTPDHADELAKIEQIFNELKPKLECGGARLRCLLDVEKKLREEVAEEKFTAGFTLGREIRRELQDAGVLSTEGRENSGIVVSEGR